MKNIILLILMCLAAGASPPLFAARAVRAAGELADFQVYLCGKPKEIKRALEIQGVKERARTMYLFESKDLKLLRNNASIRLRIKKNATELTVKRFHLNEKDFAVYKSIPGSRCEIDVHNMGLIHTRSCSLDVILSGRQSAELINGENKLSNLLSSKQSKMLNDAMGGKALSVDRLIALGPVESSARKWTDDASGLPFSIEAQLFPNGERFIELSIKTTLPGDADWIAAVTGLIKNEDLELCADQAGQRVQKLRNLLKHSQCDGLLRKG